MNDELRFPFEESLVEAAGEVGVATITTILLGMTGPMRSGETPAQWRKRLEQSGAELMNAILLAVQARQAVLTQQAEDESGQAVKQ